MPAGSGPLSLGSGTLRTLLVLASTAVAVVHLGVGRAHLHEQLTSGLFFVAVAAYQLGWALALARRPSRGVLLAAAVHLGVVAVWVLSRTSGIPLVPGGADVEGIGYPDVLALLLEGTIVYGAMALLTAESHERLHAPLARNPLTVGAAAVLAVAVGLTFVPTLAADRPGHRHGVAAGVAARRLSSNATAVPGGGRVGL